MKSILRPEARDELDNAAVYYERLRDDLGDEFIEDFLLAITEIEEAPTRWPEIERDVRRFRMSRFPYAVVYRLPGTDIDIIAIAHQSRREGYWRDRLQ
ncbi:MAG: toxin ParE2 [Humisphaera sp.]|nr:toxin ParE2 [Humisphaera sp.]